MSHLSHKVSQRYLIATRPIQINKAVIKPNAVRCYRTLLEVIEKYKPAPKFQDVDLKSTPSGLRLMGQDRHIGMLEVTPVGSDTPVSVPLILNFRVAHKTWIREFISGGRITNRGYYGDTRLSPIKMEVSVNLSNSYNDLMDPRNKTQITQEIFSVLVHELTHAKDWYPLERPPLDYEQPEVYHNLTQEVRAFMQQISDEVITYPTTNFTDLNKFFEKALDFSTTWHRIKKYLNPQNKKLILKGVWTALHDAIKSGEVKWTLSLKKVMTLKDLVKWVVSERGRLDKDAEFYLYTVNVPTLWSKFIKDAHEGTLADNLGWGAYGFTYDVSWMLREKLENELKTIHKVAMRHIAHKR